MKKHFTILFDADDTAENLVECWISMLNERYGTSVSVEDVTEWDLSSAFPSLTKEQVYGVLTEDELWSRLQPMPGSVEVLQKLKNDGHELYMVTASDYRTLKTKMERIFQLFPFLDWDHVIVAHNKQMVNGDFLIDDGTHNLVGAKYVPIIYTRPHNKNFDTYSTCMLRADSWQEVYDTISFYADLVECQRRSKEEL